MKKYKNDLAVMLQLAAEAGIQANRAEDAKRDANSAEAEMNNNTDPGRELGLACQARRLEDKAHDIALEAEAAEKKARIALEEGVGTTRTVGEFQELYRDVIARTQMRVSDEQLRSQIDRFADKLPRDLHVLSSKEWDTLESKLKELLARINKNFYCY